MTEKSNRQDQQGAAAVSGAVSQALDPDQGLYSPRAPAVRAALKNRSGWSVDEADVPLLLADRRLSQLAEQHPYTPLWLLLKLDQRRPYTGARENLLRRVARHDLTKAAWDTFVQGDWEVRAALAANPHLPGRVKRQLLADSDWWVRAALAENPTLEPADALILMEGEPPVAVRENLAAHPHTPAALLVALAADGERGVRQRVARNPSAPAAALERLALEDRAGTREAVAAHPAAPPELTAALLNDSQERVRRVAQLRQPSTGQEQLRAAAATRRRQVRLAISQHPQLPQELQERLAQDRWEWVRAEVGVRPNLPEPLRDLLREDRSPTVSRLTRAADTRTPRDELAFLPRTDLRMRRALSGNPSAPAEILEDLSTDCEYLIREQVMLNPSAPPAALLEGLPERSLRRIIRCHPQYGHVRERLYAQEIREAQDPQTLPEALLELAGSDGETVRLALTRREFPLSEPVMLALAQDSSSAVQRSLLARPDLSSAALQAMARLDADAMLLRQLLGHPRVNAEVLEILSAHPAAALRQQVAQHPLTPPAVLTRLAQTQDILVLSAVLRHPRAPAAALAQMLRYGQLHAELAAHPNTDGKTLHMLAVSPAYARQIRLARWLSRTPLRHWRWLESQLQQRRERLRADALLRLSVLEAVACHPHVQPHTTLYLSQLNHTRLQQVAVSRQRRSP